MQKNLSPLKFKRPLPPSEDSPFCVDVKRHKIATLGATPQFSPIKKALASPTSTSSPYISVIPMNISSDASDDDSEDSFTIKSLASPTFLDISPPTRSIVAHSSPEIIQPSFREPIDGSPEFATSKSDVKLKDGPTCNLEIRQFSMPAVPNFSHNKNDSNNNSAKELKCRTLSESHLSIMKALNQSENKEEILTGDFSTTFSLPLVKGRHPDLQSISAETLTDLISGKFKDKIESFKVLDCRYPYEYQGGHIKGALSWPTPQCVLDHVDAARENSLKHDSEHESTNSTSGVLKHDTNRRNILVFHCEFSAERGPRAQRLLREQDRSVNNENYPSLHYPEIYLLEGGYKAFFEQFPNHCTPENYTRMVDDDFAEDLKLHRSRSKTWNTENKFSKSKGFHWGKSKSLRRCIRKN